MTYEPFWVGLFAKALAGKNIGDLIMNIGSGAGAAPAGGAAAPAGGAAEAAAPAPEPEPESESEEDMGFGAFLPLLVASAPPAMSFLAARPHQCFGSCHRFAPAHRLATTHVLFFLTFLSASSPTLQVSSTKRFACIAELITTSLQPSDSFCVVSARSCWCTLLLGRSVVHSQ